jgi:hypothetical protein
MDDSIIEKDGIIHMDDSIIEKDDIIGRRNEIIEVVDREDTPHDNGRRSTRSNDPLSEADIMTDCKVEALKIKLLEHLQAEPLNTNSIGTLELSLPYDNKTINLSRIKHHILPATMNNNITDEQL